MGANWQILALSLTLSLSFSFSLSPTILCFPTSHSHADYFECLCPLSADTGAKTKRQRLMKMASHSDSPSAIAFEFSFSFRFGFGCGFVARTNIFNKLRVAVTKCALIGKSAVENCQKRRAESSLGGGGGECGKCSIGRGKYNISEIQPHVVNLLLLPVGKRINFMAIRAALRTLKLAAYLQKYTEKEEEERERERDSWSPGERVYNIAGHIFCF